MITTYDNNFYAKRGKKRKSRPSIGECNYNTIEYYMANAEAAWKQRNELQFEYGKLQGQIYELTAALETAKTTIKHYQSKERAAKKEFERRATLGRFADLLTDVNSGRKKPTKKRKKKK